MLCGNLCRKSSILKLFKKKKIYMLKIYYCYVISKQKIVFNKNLVLSSKILIEFKLKIGKSIIGKKKIMFLWKDFIDFIELCYIFFGLFVVLWVFIFGGGYRVEIIG